jgi:hypothetical protein
MKNKKKEIAEPAKEVGVINHIPFDLLCNAISDVFVSPQQNELYAGYMSFIIQQLPDPKRLNMLSGPSNGQASFYFLDETTGRVNATLYNNLLNQRVVGEGTINGVEQVGLADDSFVNSYLSVYTKIRYQLSPADKARQQQINMDVASTIRILVPVWNAWVDANLPANVNKLDIPDTNVALVQMTDTLNTIWLNPVYAETLKNDPSYPYTHLSIFKTIYGNIPVTVPDDMINLMTEIFRLSGAFGAITAQVANATHTLSGIINNLQKPLTGPSGNGALLLTGSGAAVPGLIFNPVLPGFIINQLNQYPVVPVAYEYSVTRLDKNTLQVKTMLNQESAIDILDFFSDKIPDESRTSIFQKACAGSLYRIKLVVNNPVINPAMNVNPLPFDVFKNTGWMLAGPAKEAILNGYPAPAEITGYVFNSRPGFQFGQNENFGYISSLIFSQFLELEIHFIECVSAEVKQYFDQHALAAFNFLGISLRANSSFTYLHYEYSNQTETSITVIIKPPPPGFIPPEEGSITQSLCHLVAVSVNYPFA